MNGLREIHAMNNPLAKRGPDFRVQRDKLAQAVKRLLAKEIGAEDFARKVLGEIDAQ